MGKDAKYFSEFTLYKSITYFLYLYKLKPVKTSYFLLILLTLTACTHQSKRAIVKQTAVKKVRPLKLADTSIADTDNDHENNIRFSDKRLENFLDSVGKLSTKALADKAAFGADSIFKNQTSLDTMISSKDLDIIKRAIQKGYIRVKVARRIFHNPDISYDCTTKSIFLTYKKGLIPIVYYPFDKDTTQFNEYAVCIGDPGHCTTAALYFFKKNRIIALHEGYNRFAPDLAHYKDADGKTVVYYGKNFGEGSGIWWNNYFFYKYEGNKLIPILNELENGNRQNFFWGPRVMWLQSTILKTNPLTIKMVYYQYLSGTASFSDSERHDDLKIADDSTLVQYSWNEATKALQGAYNKSKITKPQILSYYLVDDELLFINSNYKILKLAIHDKAKKKNVLIYLNEIKNHFAKKKA